MTPRKASAVRGPVYLDSSGDPAPIFKQERGKPSVRIEYLEQQRDAWIWPLESYWHDFGWILESARTAEDIRDAFKALTSRAESELFRPFVRATSEKATVDDIAQFHKTYEETRERLAEAETVHRQRSEAYADAQRIAFSVSEDSEKHLRTDIDQRDQRIRSLKIARSRVNARFKKYDLLRRKYAKREGRSRDFTPYLKEKLRTIETDIAADEKSRADQQKILSQITPTNRKIATEELENRKLAVEAAKSSLAEVKGQSTQAEGILLDRETVVCRNELLDFLLSKKYAIEPRQIAKALAGLPYSKCRRSAERLAKVKSSVPMLPMYEIFQFIRSHLEKWRESRSIPLTDWFEREIRRLPKFIGRGDEKRENPLRQRLGKDWYFLRHSIAAVLALKPGKIPKEYLIAQRFFAESSNPTGPTDRILADKEAIAP